MAKLSSRVVAIITALAVVLAAVEGIAVEAVKVEPGGWANGRDRELARFNVTQVALRRGSGDI